ncbi:MAG: HPr family phosphocarrier protein [Isosphaeraceae bacterium]|nr:HPr family phosphocarrier protein [Isosphaeraceae bacterium]
MTATISAQHARYRIPLPLEKEERLREAILLSDHARRFACELHLSCGDRHADVKNLLETADLLFEPHGELLLEGDGPESQQAVESLAQAVERAFPAGTRDLAILGLVDSAPLGPEGPCTLSGLSPHECLGALSLSPPERFSSNTLSGLSPRRSLEVFGLLSDEGLD